MVVIIVKYKILINPVSTLILFGNISLTLYKLSSKRSRGPVVPMMTSGWPESKANNIPATAVDTSVSDIPIRLFVLSATSIICLLERKYFTNK